MKPLLRTVKPEEKLKNLYIAIEVTEMNLRDLKKCLDKVNQTQDLKLSAIKKAVGSVKHKNIHDGFGNSWSAWCPACKKRTMVIVKPGMAICMECG